MKKILAIIWILILLIFVWINFKNFKDFYNNNFENYSEAKNKYWEYNMLLKKWNELYTSSTLSWTIINNKITSLEQSVDSYSKALDIFPNEYTGKNLEFVQEKLRILKLQQEKQKQDTNKPSPESSSKGEEKEQKKEWWETSKKEQKWEKWDKKESWETWEKKAQKKWDKKESWKKDENWQNSWEKNKDWEKKWLSEETKKILEQKAKELQEQQWEIWKFYNKNYKPKQKNAFDNFADIFGNSLFDNWLLDESEEKDW